MKIIRSKEQVSECVAEIGHLPKTNEAMATSVGYLPGASN